jgi:hypothetical protein
LAVAVVAGVAPVELGHEERRIDAVAVRQGDIHQPLHDTTNNDRGGKCVPVAFFDHAPKETNPAYETYNPNLNENLAADYQNAAAPVVQDQLAKAGGRPAALLNSIWP